MGELVAGSRHNTLPLQTFRETYGHVRGFKRLDSRTE
jgi:hypothetical protein